MKDRAAWAIEPAAVHGELATLMGLTAEETRLLTALHGAASDRAPALAEDFYGRLLAHPETAEFLAETDVEARHRTISQWFVALFEGDYGPEFVASRLRIGQVHVVIGLPVRYPLAMLDIVLHHGEAVCAASDDPATAQAALRKVLALDVAVFNQAYEDNQLRHLSTLVGGERLARRLLAGEG
ncbi:MAG: protoglobin domain-containing protein [Acidobacteriota bacterium]